MKGWETMGKNLVAYFSPTGTTKKAARRLADMTGADLYEIRPEVPYTAPDLNWQDSGSRSSVEMKDSASRPAIADHDANVEAYDTVFIGFPIWWYTAPTIIKTFIEAYDFSGKTIVFFATSGGTDVMKATTDLMETLNGRGKIRGGILMSNPVFSDMMLKEWVKNLQIP